MKLRVLYRKQGDPLPRHIQVTADATVTSGDVARALLKGPAADVDIDEAARPTLRVTDQAGGVTVLPPGQLVVNSGVVSGAVLEVVPGLLVSNCTKSSPRLSTKSDSAMTAS